ncbi:MAG: isoprenyl transferase [Flavobacteriales bacterium]|nr:isoprenyl transferase [Flavobacteriales bacterium]
MTLKEEILKHQIPKHIAVIMDGNGRWAKQQGKFRIFGHQHGVESVREISEGCAEIGVKYLTLYAFSTENWNRPKLEVDALMTLLVKTIKKETKTLMKNNIRLGTIGDKYSLPKECINELEEAIESTKNNNGMTLILALSYSAKRDMTLACKQMANELREQLLTQEEITEEYISSKLSTAGIPDPDLMIRTSGEHRISNFLLWEMAYTEFYFTDVLWPDFRKEHLYEAIMNYQKRERRFGKTGEQIANV